MVEQYPQQRVTHLFILDLSIIVRITTRITTRFCLETIIHIRILQAIQTHNLLFRLFDEQNELDIASTNLTAPIHIQISMTLP